MPGPLATQEFASVYQLENSMPFRAFQTSLVKTASFVDAGFASPAARAIPPQFYLPNQFKQLSDPATSFA